MEGAGAGIEGMLKAIMACMACMLETGQSARVAAQHSRADNHVALYSTDLVRSLGGLHSSLCLLHMWAQDGHRCARFDQMRLV